MGYIGDDRCLDNAKEDEPIFVILGRDPVAVLAVLEWIKVSFYNQPDEKLREAFEHCLKMRNYPKKYDGISKDFQPKSFKEEEHE